MSTSDGLGFIIYSTSGNERIEFLCSDVGDRNITLEIRLIRLNEAHPALSIWDVSATAFDFPKEYLFSIRDFLASIFESDGDKEERYCSPDLSVNLRSRESGSTMIKYHGKKELFVNIHSSKRVQAEILLIIDPTNLYALTGQYQ